MNVMVSRLVVVAWLACYSAAWADDPLPSWNAGPTKSAIVDFVGRVTAEDGPRYVAPAERIAVFDNDGTLWPENPVPFQLAFVLDELKRLAPEHPEWKTKSHIQAALAGDVVKLKEDGSKALVQLLAATHAGITTEQFNVNVRQWMKTARHPRFHRPYNRLAYQPMLELLAYLRANGFKTFIVSGGGADFMRVWAEETYGIPSEQVIGSIGSVRFEIHDGQPVLVKQPGIDFVNDKAGKPVGIHRFIGRRPIAAFGNSDGDLQMLQWTTIGQTPSFGLLVHHTDAKREWAYDKASSSSGKLIEALAEAPERGWIVVDMKNDWKTLFSSYY